MVGRREKKQVWLDPKDYLWPDQGVMRHEEEARLPEVTSIVTPFESFVESGGQAFANCRGRQRGGCWGKRIYGLSGAARTFIPSQKLITEVLGCLNSRRSAPVKCLVYQWQKLNKYCYDVLICLHADAPLMTERELKALQWGERGYVCMGEGARHFDCCEAQRGMCVDGVIVMQNWVHRIQGKVGITGDHSLVDDLLQCLLDHGTQGSKVFWAKPRLSWVQGTGASTSLGRIRRVVLI